jgi:hypothetical protein
MDDEPEMPAFIDDEDEPDFDIDSKIMGELIAYRQAQNPGLAVKDMRWCGATLLYLGALKPRIKQH